MNRSIPLPRSGKSETTDYELEYNKNWAIRQQQMAELLKSISPLLVREQDFANPPKRPKVKRAVKRKSVDNVAPTRRSARHQELADGAIKSYGSTMDFEPKRSNPKTRRRRTVQHKAGPPTPLNVEDVTEDLLANISQSSSQKVYSQDGTTCHQCRQKTLDTKTVCRSKYCVGVRGQFCEQCLFNHYGQHVRDALLNKDWKCPICRDICNCSICRTRKNKVPLGIIIHLVRDQGFSSVHEFIKSEENDDDEALELSEDEELDTTDENDNEDTSCKLVVDKAVYDAFERQHLREQ